MGEDFLCQADTSAKGADGVAPEGALQAGLSEEALRDRETFADPTDILPMGGGYDWRCFVNKKYGIWFLCKDGFPLRDSSEWNKKGWRVCSVEIGSEKAIEVFAATVRSAFEAVTQSKIEEPGTGDEVEAEHSSASLTPHQTKAQEIINWTISEGTKDFTALHSAIVYTLEDGRILIVGENISDWEALKFGIQVDPKGNETAIVISPDFLADLPEITHLRSQLQKLREALEPFAKIEPSSFYPSDGSEEEGYTVIPDGKAEDVGISSGPDFTGADLARARAVLQETSPEATGGDNG
jgi:hypothetical protein